MSPMRVSKKKGRDRVIQQTEDQDNMNDDEMKMLFDAAALIRKSIQMCKKWVFPAPSITALTKMYPGTLQHFRWVIQGSFDLFSLEKSSVRYTSVP